MAARKAGARKPGGARRKSSRGAGRSGGSLWPWVGALVLVVGGVSAYDHRRELPGWLNSTFGFGAKEIARLEGSRQEPKKPMDGPIPLASVPTPAARRLDPTPLPPATTMTPTESLQSREGDRAPLPPATTLVSALPAPTVVRHRASGKFYYCGTTGLDNCVVDGDTFWFNKVKIRVADIDAPETEQAKCKAERDRGFAAKVRLRELLNAGGFAVESFGARDEDQYGRKLRVITRNGRSLGGVMVEEGLARPWTGHRMSWCNG
ncbi:endonuclease YncB(thermonuclease family) [Agrobacterium vitis]|nr:endonuclease YncB(thermonuclease family) [Agrobacterium vitis]MBE1440309.1 endonuclease YncB(thermonuclease family) [Agrobacterium vitis]